MCYIDHMKIFIPIVYLICSSYLFAMEEADLKLWKDGKITEEQPFKGKIVAGGGRSPWSGATALYLKEEGEGANRYLEVVIGINTGINNVNGVYYNILTKKEYDAVIKRMETQRFYGATIFLDPVDVDKFAWGSPVGFLGKGFGHEDVVTIFSTKKQP